MKRSENFACWFCDYGGIIIFILLVVGIAWLVRNQIDDTEEPVSYFATPRPTSTMTSVPTAAPTQVPTLASTVVPEVTPTVQPQNPDYIIAFIPVQWTGTEEEFESTALEHFEYFVRESDIGSYFNVSIEYIYENMTDIELTSDTLVIDVVEFGLTQLAADRYVGLTDGDIILEGESWVAGWTFGEDYLGVVAEAAAVSVTAHELGHTYGLCDIYAYEYWDQQDTLSPGGCPNSFPNECSITEDICYSSPNEDGEYPIMGLSIPGAQQYFTTESFNALADKFIELGGGVE